VFVETAEIELNIRPRPDRKSSFEHETMANIGAEAQPVTQTIIKLY